MHKAKSVRRALFLMLATVSVGAAGPDPLPNMPHVSPPLPAQPSPMRPPRPARAGVTGAAFHRRPRRLSRGPFRHAGGGCRLRRDGVSEGVGCRSEQSGTDPAGLRRLRHGRPAGGRATGRIPTRQPGGGAAADRQGRSRRQLGCRRAAHPRPAGAGGDAGATADPAGLGRARRRPDRDGARDAAAADRRAALPQHLRLARRDDRRRRGPHGGCRQAVSPGAVGLRRGELAAGPDHGELAGAAGASGRRAAHLGRDRGGDRPAYPGVARPDRRQHDAPRGAPE